MSHLAGILDFALFQVSASLAEIKEVLPSKIDLPHLEEVNKPAGSGDHDLATVLQITELGALRRSPEHTGVLQTGALPEHLGYLLDLLSQLPDKRKKDFKKCNFRLLQQNI